MKARDGQFVRREISQESEGGNTGPDRGATLFRLAILKSAKGLLSHAFPLRGGVGEGLCQWMDLRGNERSPNRTLVTPFRPVNKKDVIYY